MFIAAIGSLSQLNIKTRISPIHEKKKEKDASSILDPCLWVFIMYSWHIHIVNGHKTNKTVIMLWELEKNERVGWRM